MLWWVLYADCDTFRIFIKEGFRFWFRHFFQELNKKGRFDTGLKFDKAEESRLEFFSMCCTTACIKCLTLLKYSGSSKVNQITETPFLKYKTFYKSCQVNLFIRTILKKQKKHKKRNRESRELLLWCEVFVAGSLWAAATVNKMAQNLHPWTRRVSFTPHSWGQ